LNIFLNVARLGAPLSGPTGSCAPAAKRHRVGSDGRINARDSFLGRSSAPSCSVARVRLALNTMHGRLMQASHPDVAPFSRVAIAAADEEALGKSEGYPVCPREARPKRGAWSVL
jgi:hypothetical protein